MAKKEVTIEKTNKTEEVKPIQKTTPKPVKEESSDVATSNPVEELKAIREEENKKEEADGRVWVDDWRDLVKVEGSKQDKLGVQYYGVKR